MDIATNLTTEQRRKAAAAGDMVQNLMEGNAQAAIRKGAEVLRISIAEDMAGFSSLVDSLATLMKQMPGNFYGLTERAGVLSYSTLLSMPAKNLLNVVFALAAERAQEVNAANELAKAPVGRPVRDHPQA